MMHHPTGSLSDRWIRNFLMRVNVDCSVAVFIALSVIVRRKFNKKSEILSDRFVVDKEFQWKSAQTSVR